MANHKSTRAERKAKPAGGRLTSGTEATKGSVAPKTKRRAKAAGKPREGVVNAKQARKPASAAVAAVPEPDNQLVLPHTLEIGGIRDFHQECVRLMDREPENVVLNGKDIAFIDTAGVQLLACVVRSLRQRNCDIAWENFSVQVYQVAAELGLEEEIGC